MAHKRQLEKEAAIRKMVNKMSSKKKYTMDWIFQTVGKQFFMEPKTVEHIIYGQYDKRRNRKHEKS